jgi:hypothetical protein
LGCNSAALASTTAIVKDHGTGATVGNLTTNGSGTISGTITATAGQSLDIVEASGRFAPKNFTYSSPSLGTVTLVAGTGYACGCCAYPFATTLFLTQSGVPVTLTYGKVFAWGGVTITGWYGCVSVPNASVTRFINGGGVTDCSAGGAANTTFDFLLFISSGACKLLAGSNFCCVTGGANPSGLANCNYTHFAEVCYDCGNQPIPATFDAAVATVSNFTGNAGRAVTVGACPPALSLTAGGAYLTSTSIFLPCTGVTTIPMWGTCTITE